MITARPQYMQIITGAKVNIIINPIKNIVTLTTKIIPIRTKKFALQQNAYIVRTKTTPTVEPIAMTTLGPGTASTTIEQLKLMI